VLGEGAFGVVVKAEAYGLGSCDSSRVVAVKMLKGDRSKYVFFYVIVYCVSTDISRTKCRDYV